MSLIELGGAIKEDAFTILIYMWLFYFLRSFISKRKDEEKGLTASINKSRPIDKKRIIFGFLAFILGVATLSYRYFVFPFPQGYDNPFYIYWSELIDNPNLLPFALKILLGRIVSVLFVKFFISLLGYYNGIIATNLFFGGLFVAGIYFLVSELESDKLGIYAALFTSFSFFFYRLYLDLLANQIAWSFSPFVLLFYQKFKNENTKKSFYLFSLMLILMFFSHVWSTLILIAAMFFDFFIVSQKGEKSFSYIKNLVFLLAIASIVMSIINYKFLYGALIIFVNQMTAGVEKRYMFVSRESAVLLFLSIIGAYRISACYKPRRSIIYSVYAFLSILLVIGFFYNPYRVTNLYPFGVLSAYGYDFLLKRLQSFNIGKIKIDFTADKIKHGFILALVLTLTVSTGSTSYLHDHVLIPSKSDLDQLWFIRSQFGFNNTDIVVLVDKLVEPVNGIGWANIYYWLNAIIGRVYFTGTIMDYIQKLDRKILSDRTTENYYSGYKSKIPENKTIVIPDRWYVVTSLEKNVSRYIGSGVYVIERLNASKIIEILEEMVSYKHPLNSSYQIISGWESYTILESSNLGYLVLNIKTHDNSTQIGVEFELSKLFGPLDSLGTVYLHLKLNTSILANYTLVLDNGKNKTVYSTLSDLEDMWLSVNIFRDVLRPLHISIYVQPQGTPSFELEFLDIVIATST